MLRRGSRASTGPRLGRVAPIVHALVLVAHDRPSQLLEGNGLLTRPEDRRTSWINVDEAVVRARGIQRERHTTRSRRCVPGVHDDAVLRPHRALRAGPIQTWENTEPTMSTSMAHISRQRRRGYPERVPRSSTGAVGRAVRLPRGRSRNRRSGGGTTRCRPRQRSRAPPGWRRVRRAP